MPGLAAKPIIDLMAATGDLDGVGARERGLHLLGYGFHDTGMPGGFCTAAALPARGRTICVLSRPAPCRPGIRCCVTTCADTSDDATRYGASKRRLAALHANGGDYTRAKTELIQELTDKARAERGLSPAPVWEE